MGERPYPIETQLALIRRDIEEIHYALHGDGKGRKGLVDQVEDLVTVADRGRFSLRLALWLGGGGAVNRIPASDDLRSNMVRGGAPSATELTKREAEICKRIGPALRERGLLFVGIDVIDGYLTEINVTSPTGIRAIKNLGGPDIAALIWDKIEAKRRA